jgi:DNA primase
MVITGKNKLKVISVLDGVLGAGTSMKGNEQSHHCPFCHHHKKKLQINLNTQNYHCWVCDAKGRSLIGLLKRLNSDTSDIRVIYDIYGETTNYTSYTQSDEPAPKLHLPPEFRSLLHQPKGVNPEFGQAMYYLHKRGIDKMLIKRYNIGYCDSGVYGGRIIIPSYDEEGELNYFEARTYREGVALKYKKPPINRNVIMFENQISWKDEITLVEGVFDAFAIRRNAIPILGKYVPKKLTDRIFMEGVKRINIILDNDAVNESTHWTLFFQRNGIDVKNIIPKAGDVGDMSQTDAVSLMKNYNYADWSSIVLDKINNI